MSILEDEAREQGSRWIIWVVLAALGIGGTNSFITLTRTEDRYTGSDADRDRRLIELQINTLSQQLTTITAAYVNQEERHDEALATLHRRIQEESREAKEDLKEHEQTAH